MTKNIICEVDGCQQPVIARGWCSKHYQRWQKYGNVQTVRSKGSGITVCTAEGCNRGGKIVKGYCLKHYQHFMKYGDIQHPKGKSGPSPDKSDEARFQEKFEITDSCWVWKAYRNQGGYGSFSVKGRMRLAHRVSFEMFKGELEPSDIIDHICRNRSCVNPEHLRVVDRSGNAQNHNGKANGVTKSGVRNVWWDKASDKWKVTVCLHGKSYHGGYFKDIESAAVAAKQLRNKLFTTNELDKLEG